MVGQDGGKVKVLGDWKIKCEGAESDMIETEGEFAVVRNGACLASLPKTVEARAFINALRGM